MAGCSGGLALQNTAAQTRHKQSRRESTRGATPPAAVCVVVSVVAALRLAG